MWTTHMPTGKVRIYVGMYTVDIVGAEPSVTTHKTEGCRNNKIQGNLLKSELRAVRIEWQNGY